MTAAIVLFLLAGSVPPVHAQDAAQAPVGDDATTYAILPFNTAYFVSYYPPAWWADFRPIFFNNVSDMLTTEMNHSGLHVVSRDKIEQLLKEQNMQASDKVAPESAVKFGKLLGAKYLITGSITDWRIYNQNTPVGPIMIKKADAKCSIDFQVINVETGEVTTTDVAKGEEKKSGVAFGDDWFQSLTNQNAKWQESQIGVATRRAVKDIVAKMLGRNPDEMPVEAMKDADHAIIEIDESMKLRKGDKIEFFLNTDVKRNRRGKVIYKNPKILGHGEIEEVQENGAVIRITDRAGNDEIKEGCLARRKR